MSGGVETSNLDEYKSLLLEAVAAKVNGDEKLASEIIAAAIDTLLEIFDKWCKNNKKLREQEAKKLP